MKVEARKVVLRYRNLKEVRLNYYLMDIELLFSRQPFVQNVGGGGFAYIRPNMTRVVEAPADKQELSVELPEKFASANVMVEAVAAGIRKTQPYLANELNVLLTENYGHLLVTHIKTGKPLGKVYVKVYAKLNDGRDVFYKDGYTDLRGRFDYTSLNTSEINRVVKFSLLILSPEHGAVIREAQPPRQ
jgi:hypothetical protein